MSFKYLTLVALLASTFSIAQAHAEPANIQADCFYIGGTSLTNDGLISGATQSDAAFNTAKGIITLTPKQMVQRGGFGELNYTLWQAKQKINLGHGYALLVYLSYQNQHPSGDFVIDFRTLTTSSILTFKGQPIGSSSTSAEQPQVDNKGKKILNVTMQIDNLPLRVFLGATNSPEADLSDLATNYSSLNDLYKKFGDGSGVLTQASVNCNVQIP